MTTAPMMTTEEALRRRPVSARMRILGWYVALLAVALVAALLLQRALLLSQVSSDADEALDQEVEELRQLAGGNDPETGEPFGGDVATIFDVFLSRNAPLTGEAVVTFVQGDPYKADITGSELVGTPLADEWASLTEPSRGEVDTSAGPLRYLAVPVGFDGDVAGVFVVAIFLADALAGVNDALRVGALVYGSIFLVATAFAWVAAGGVLRPLRDLSETAGAITDTNDLSRRIPAEGSDEIADLGRTFNAMLDRLEEAFETQRRFVDDAGHELRTPITVIRGHLELMGDDPTERAETVEVVTDELDRMSRIVDDLLLLAKSEQGDFIDPHPMDLGTFTTEIIGKARVLDDRPWSIDRREEAVVVADQQRLTQAVMNLVRNAVEHTPAGTPVAVGTARAGDRVEVWVRDEGPGVDPAEVDHLFERFHRGAEGRRSTDGAGLGLAIVRAIAEGHGGDVTVTGGPGRGSTFTIRIPAEGG
jgi:signal transduction histidine kinase